MNKVGYRLLAATWIVSTMSGCASVNDNPYYKAWQTRAYEIRAIKDQMGHQQMNQQVAYDYTGQYVPQNTNPTAAMVGYSNMGNPQQNRYTNNYAGTQTPVDPSIYAVEDNPYQAYSEQAPYTTY
jgi:hypothetical protein